MKAILYAGALFACSVAVVIGAEDNPQATEEAAIRKAVESYVVAFNQGNAQALAAMWSPEAVYTNPLSGVQVTGREAIEEQFAGVFVEAKGVKLEASTESIQFISPGVAVENGTATLLGAEMEPERSTYTAIITKE
jgi:uncharacterized protein (TIGR02246 family)